MILKELSNIIGLPLSQTLQEYTVTNVGGRVVSVSNFGALVQYDNEKIVLKIKKNELVVEGFNLNITSLSAKEIVIKGKIIKTYLRSGSVPNEESK